MSIGYGIFGTPHGLQWKAHGLLSNADIGRFLDLPSEKVTIAHPDLILRVHKASINKEIYCFYLLYGHAQEMESNRTGTFCGTFFITKKPAILPELIFGLLTELFSGLNLYIAPKSKAFLKPLNKIPLYPPLHFSLIKSVLSESLQNPKVMPGKCAVIDAKYSRHIELLSFIDASINHPTLKEYENLYFIWDKGGNSAVNYQKARLSMDYHTFQKKATEKKDELRSTIEKSVREKHKLLSQLNNIQHEYKSLSSELQATKTELFQLQNKIHHNKVALERINQTKTKEQKSILQLSSESKNLDIEIDHQQTMLKKLSEKYLSLQNEYEDLRMKRTRKEIKREFAQIKADSKE